MTNLSQQLCKICGIEPKQFTKDFKTREKAASFGRKITGIPKFRGNKFDIGSYTDNQSIYQVHWKEFPDFEQPENLVKLLEIIHARMSIEGLLMDEIDEASLTRRFLKLVIKFLNGELGYIETKINAVKQAIRAEEWKYE